PNPARNRTHNLLPNHNLAHTPSLVCVPPASGSMSMSRSKIRKRIRITSKITSRTSRTAAELRAVAVHVLDRVDVAPGDLIGIHAKGCCQALALFRARRIARLDDRLDDALVEV